MTYDLNPVTRKILDHAVSLIRVHNPDWSSDQAQELVLKIIREEEIRNERFLVHFCKLSIDERKDLWRGIFENLANHVPNKKSQKKFLKECLDNVEFCLNGVVQETNHVQEKNSVNIKEEKTGASI